MCLVTIGIPTRDRPKSLGRLLASIHAQTFKDWDLTIVDDSSGDMLDENGEMWLEIIRRSHVARVIPGVRINQTYAHNCVLWHSQSAPLILRLDDDINLRPDFLERLFAAWAELQKQGINVGGLGGVYFTEHLYSRVENPPIPTRMHSPTTIAPDGTLSPYAQMQEYTDDSLIPAHHLYSSYLYDRDAMRSVGGFPLVYSEGCSYHEETEASYKLSLAGYELFIVPAATAIHSHENTGGTRLLPAAEHRRRVESDWRLFLNRLWLIRGVNFKKPSIALYSDHWRGVGGGQRLTYSLAKVLLSLDCVGAVDFVCPPHEDYESDKFVRENFGIELHTGEVGLFKPSGPDMDWEEAVYDVVISVGHTPPDPRMIPPRRHHIHYSLYPMENMPPPQGVNRHAAISAFSARSVLREYYRQADVVYPCVPEVTLDKIEKENLVLVVGRTVGKSSLTLADAFMNMKSLPENTRLVFVAPDESSVDQKYLSELSRYSRVELRTGLTNQELSELYARAKVLWAARGYGLPEHPAELNREHFGYTPIEALRHYCLPIAFNAGGYVETCTVLWDDLEQLGELTLAALTDRDKWEAWLKGTLPGIYRFDEETFEREWLRIITSTLSYAWMAEIENRVPGSPDIRITRHDVHVACVVEHPGNMTGYGVVSRECLRGLNEAGFKLHVFGINGQIPDLRQEFASLWTNPENEDHARKFKRFISHRHFDAAFVAYDPFVSRRFVRAISSGPYRIPIVGYISQEGLPPSHWWEDILAKVDVPITYCKHGAWAIEERYGHKVDWVHLGVDHAPFEKYDDRDRQALRAIMGWEDKFVLMCVARNARNKNISGLISILRRLQDIEGGERFLLLLDTEQAPDQRFHGIDVDMYSKMIGVMDNSIVIVPSIPGVYSPYESDVSDLLGKGTPRKKGAWLRDAGMIARYNMADLYVDISSAEGFGLPLYEAMACGLPVLTAKDHFVRSEVTRNHSSLLPTREGSVWITGARLREVHENHVADRIMALEKGCSIGHFLGIDYTICCETAQEIISGLKWDNVREKIVAGVESCLK